MNKTSLVIMAAGIGSRYGGGIKQLAKVGPSGEIIMDYSIYDALGAGFDKVVFIIRKDIEKDFREIIGNRIDKLCETEYVFQELSDLPDGFCPPAGRTKPWGTGQAILACRGKVNEPFLVINADDYYGRQPYEMTHKFLTEKTDSKGKERICMSGYVLKNTLSDNGAVTRGICSVSGENRLVGIKETKNIFKTELGAESRTENGDACTLDPDLFVSMNMWGLEPSFIEKLAEGFEKFLKDGGINDLKGEYLLPTIIDQMIKDNAADVTMLKTSEKWFGMTYKEDLPQVRSEIEKLIKDGGYPENILKSLEENY